MTGKREKPQELTGEQETEAEIQANGENLLKLTGDQETVTEIGGHRDTCQIDRRG
jgi:hypothetical protein